MIIPLKKLSTKFTKMVNNSKAFSVFYYSPCILCGEPSPFKLKLCQHCLEDLPINSSSCIQCALPLPITLANVEMRQSLRCGECIAKPPPFTLTQTPYRYDFPVSTMIQHAKYHNQRYLLKPLCTQFASVLEQHLKTRTSPDFLIPVPMHAEKLKQRHFNQSHYICQILSKKLLIAENTHILQKIKTSKSQAKLNRTERLKNLKETFALANAQILKGKHVALIDDVMTTRATAETCARLLLDNGAGSVEIWCLARTPKQNS